MDPAEYAQGSLSGRVRKIVIESDIVFEEPASNSAEEADGRAVFAFVNATGPIAKNSIVQRSIRKHVMREIGKSRRKDAKSRSPESKQNSPETVAPVSIISEASPELWESVQLVLRQKKGRSCAHLTCATSLDDNSNISIATELNSVPLGYHREQQEITLFEDESLPRISRFLGGRIDPFLHYPIEMTTDVKRLVDHAFDSRRNIKFYRDQIFPIGQTGPASFHQALANLAAYLRLARRIEGAVEYEAREEREHQAVAYKLVKTKITTEEATSEDIIGAVAAMACHAHVVQDMRALRMHINGLKTIVQLRGGAETLRNPALRIALYWLDVNCGTTEDCIPNWPFPTSLPFRPELPDAIKLSSGIQPITIIWRAQFPDRTEIMDIFEDVSRVSLHLEAEVRRTAGHIYTDVVFFSNMINSLTFRLLQIQPRVTSELETPHGPIKEATRLGLLLFLAEIRRHFGLHPVNTAVQVEKLREVLLRKVDWTGFRDLKLWIGAMGVLEAEEESLVRWFVDDWTRTTIEERMTVPARMERVVKSIMWLDTVHGGKYRQLHKSRFWGEGRVIAPKPNMVH